MSLALDGNASNHANSANTVSATLTTTNSNDWIVAIVTNFSTGSLGGASSPGMTVSGGGLSWACQYNIETSGSSHPLQTFVFIAPAPTALSSQSITATVVQTGLTSFLGLEVFGVSGADPYYPFDTNTALGTGADNTHGGSGGSANHTCTFSTTDANTFAFAVLAANETSGTTKTADSSWTAIDQPISTDSVTRTEYQVFSSTQSSVAQNVWVNDTVSTNYTAFVDAFRKVQSSEWAGPQFVSSAGSVTSSASSSTGFNATLPTTVNGDVLIAFITVGSASGITFTLPAGWNLVGSAGSDATNSMSWAIYWKNATGSEGSTVNIKPSTTESMEVVVVQYSNCKSGTPVGAHASNSGNNTTSTLTSVTTTGTNSVVIGSSACVSSSDFRGVPSRKWLARGFATNTSQSPDAMLEVWDEGVAVSGTQADSQSITLSFSQKWITQQVELLAPSTVVGTGTSGGSATVSGTGVDAIFSTGTITDAGPTVSGVGRALALSTGTASVNAGPLVTAVGRSLALSVGTAAGSATVSGLSQTLGESGGSATVSGVGRALALSVGTAAGSATVSGVGAAAVHGTSGGSATVSGVGAAAVIATGTAGGFATVTGFGTYVLSPLFDTSVSATGSDSSLPSTTISTAKAGEWLVSIISIYSSNASETSFSLQLGLGVSSPSLPNWGLRRRYAVNTGLGAGNLLEVEVWAAYAPTALTNEKVSLTVNNPQTSYISMETFAVQNCDANFPWDSGITSAAERDVEGTADSNHNHPVNFTTNSGGFLFEHLAEQNSSGSASVTVDSGWTALSQLSESSSLYSRTAYKLEPNGLGSTSQNVWANDTTEKEYIALVDSMRGSQGTWNGPVFVDGETTTFGSAFSSVTSATMNLQSTLTAGNVAIAFISITGVLGGGSTPTSVTWPAGWTKISEFKDTGGSHPQTGSWAWKKITGTEGSSMTVSWTNNGQAGMCQCYQYSNANTLGPIGNYSTSLSAATTTSITNTPPTTSQNNSLVAAYLDFAEPDPLAAPDGYTARRMGSQVSGIIGSWHLSDQPIATEGTTASSAAQTAPASSAWLLWNYEILAAPPGATSSGHATVLGVGGGIYLRTATISASATVSGVGRSLAKATGTAGGIATVTAGVGAVGASSGHATVSGVGIRAKVAVGTAGGSATVDGESPLAIGSFDTVDNTDIMDFEGYPQVIGQWNPTENTDLFSAFVRQPITERLVAVEAPDKMNFQAFTTGAGGTFTVTEHVDTLTMKGYTAAVGTATLHERADVFLATGAGAAHAKRRRVFIVT